MNSLFFMDDNFQDYLDSADNPIWMDDLPWSEPPPDIPNPLESSSDSFREPEPVQIPEIQQIVNFADTLQLKDFIHNNQLDNTWYCVLAIKDSGAIRADNRPNKSKVHPCYLFQLK